MNARRVVEVDAVRPGKRIELRIRLARSLREWADSNPLHDPVEHAHRVSDLSRLVDEVRVVIADDRARTAALLWQEGIRQCDVAELMGVSRTRLSQMLDRASSLPRTTSTA